MIHSELRPLAQKDLTGLWGILRRFLLLAAGSLLLSINIRTLVRSGGLVPGGFNGLTIFIQKVANTYYNVQIPFTPVNILLNAIPIVISFRFIGKKFTLYSCLMILTSGVLTDLLPDFQVTNDILLAAIFGGGLNAVAILCCLMAGATSGGTDFIAIFISEKFGTNAWNYVLLFNVALLGATGALFGWDKALYSMLFQFTSTQVLNVFYRKYQKVTLFIISDKADEIYDVILKCTNHDATLFKGTGCYRNAERSMLYSVVSADEVHALIHAIHQTDPAAFLNAVKSQQILGKFYRKPND